MSLSLYASAIPTTAYRPRSRETIKGPPLLQRGFKGGFYRPSPARVGPRGKITSGFAADLMHLVRRLSKATRLPGTQGFLTGKREMCLRVILRMMRKFDVAYPSYRRLRQETPCCNDVIRDTLELIEALGLGRVIRIRMAGTQFYHPSRIMFDAKLPSRFDKPACDEWVERFASQVLPEMQRQQDESIFLMAWGMAAFTIWGKRALAFLAEQDRQRQAAMVEMAIARAKRDRQEAEENRQSPEAPRSDSRQETKPNSSKNQEEEAPPLTRQQVINQRLMQEQQQRHRNQWAKSRNGPS